MGWMSMCRRMRTIMRSRMTVIRAGERPVKDRIEDSDICSYYIVSMGR